MVLWELAKDVRFLDQRYSELHERQHICVCSLCTKSHTGNATGTDEWQMNTQWVVLQNRARRETCNCRKSNLS